MTLHLLLGWLALSAAAPAGLAQYGYPGPPPMPGHGMPPGPDPRLPPGYPLVQPGVTWYAYSPPPMQQPPIPGPYGPPGPYGVPVPPPDAPPLPPPPAPNAELPNGGASSGDKVPSVSPIPLEGLPGGQAGPTAPSTPANPGEGCTLGNCHPTLFNLCGCSCNDHTGWTFQMMGGYYANTRSPIYDYVPFVFRLGKQLDLGIDHGILRGYLEPIIEVNAASSQELGHAFAGGTAILRYNFVPCECCRLSPYIQAGVGLQYNDAFRDPTQTALGQALVYTAQAQVGLRYFIRRDLSLDVETGYQALSNFGSSSRNGGIGAVGGSVGFTYYFPTFVR